MKQEFDNHSFCQSVVNTQLCDEKLWFEKSKKNLTIKKNFEYMLDIPLDIE